MKTLDLVQWIRSKLARRIEIIAKRSAEIDHAIKMYELDAWGNSAFGNVKAIKKLRIELGTLERKNNWFDIIINLLPKES